MVNLSSHFQQPFSAIILLWSGVGGQLFSHHVAVVRGRWSAIVTSCCCGQGLVVSYSHIMLLWSRVGGSCWWSIAHAFFRRTLSRSFRELHQCCLFRRQHRRQEVSGPEQNLETLLSACFATRCLVFQIACGAKAPRCARDENPLRHSRKQWLLQRIPNLNSTRPTCHTGVKGAKIYKVVFSVLQKPFFNTTSTIGVFLKRKPGQPAVEKNEGKATTQDRSRLPKSAKVLN